jgi:hypothetical protein
MPLWSRPELLARRCRQNTRPRVLAIPQTKRTRVFAKTCSGQTDIIQKLENNWAFRFVSRCDEWCLVLSCLVLSCLAQRRVVSAAAAQRQQPHRTPGLQRHPLGQDARREQHARPRQGPEGADVSTRSICPIRLIDQSQGPGSNRDLVALVLLVAPF